MRDTELGDFGCAVVASRVWRYVRNGMVGVDMTLVRVVWVVLELLEQLISVDLSGVGSA